jgi:hypothetical protein
MPSIEVDSVLRGLNSNNRVQDYARQEQGVWQKLTRAGLSGANMDAYGAAIKELQGLNETARLDKSAAGASLSPGETLDLKDNIARVNDLGTKAMREYLGGGDSLTTGGDGAKGDAAAKATPPAAAAGAPSTGRTTTTTPDTRGDTKAADAKAGDAKAADAKPASTGGTGTSYRQNNTTLDQVAKGEGVLKEGDKGPGVGEAQALLRQITGKDGKPKYDLGTSGENKDGVDNLLGPKSKASIEQFKKDQGLKSDGTGSVDKETLERMRAVAGASTLDEAYKPSGSTTPGKPAAAAECRIERGTTEGSSSTGGTNAIGNAPSNTSAGPIRFQNGEVTVQGSSANEDIVMRKNGDNYKVEYARREGDRVVERHSLEVPADQLKSARVLGGGGTDRIWNGDGKAAGVDGAELIVSGGNSSVINHGKGAKIGLEAHGFVDNFGDGAKIVSTRDRRADRSDWVANAGRNVDIVAAPGAKIDNTGDGARIRAAGYNQINSVANGVAIDSLNQAPDRGMIIGDGNVLRFDRGDANGSVAVTNLEALGQGVVPGLAKRRLAPTNAPVPEDISKK